MTCYRRFELRNLVRIVLPSATLLLFTALSAPAQSSGFKDTDFIVGGSPTAPIKIEVFSDYQCPACRTFYLETIRPLLADYARINKVCVVYHDFPLQMHTFSREAARYALAARRLGTDPWLRVSDALYSDQAFWAQDGSVEAVVGRALSPSEMAKVRKLARDPEIEETIEREIGLARSRNINSTPTFFVTVNGKEQRTVGGISYAILRSFLDGALQ